MKQKKRETEGEIERGDKSRERRKSKQLRWQKKFTAN
jgi:hypothetical protein